MKKRTARILIAIPIAAVIVIGLVYGIAVALAAAELRRVYAALEADGRPMKAADVIPSAVLDVDNAAVLYQSAIAMLQEIPVDEKDLLGHLSSLCASFVNDSLGPEVQAEFTQWMEHEAVARALSLVVQAQQRPACSFNRDYSEGPSMKVPFLAELRQLMFIVGAAARRQAEAGDWTKAWDTVQVGLRLADALRSDPIVISQMVRMAMSGFSCDLIQKLCELAPPDSGQYERIDRLLADLDDITPLTRAVDAERLVLDEQLFNLPREQRYPALRDRLFAESNMPEIVFQAFFCWVTFKPVFLADHAAYLKAMHESARLMERPYAPDTQVDMPSARHILSSMLTPAVHRIKEIHCRATARIRITRTGLMLLRYRDIHNAFPPTLDALGVEVLIDSFTQGPLHYRAEADGFVVYSVGEDLKDNDGHIKQRRENTNYDIVWRFGSESDKGEPADDEGT